ncbi:MAG TPA: hypothetical protein VIY96_08735 [Thermoanaerobaculia bacterium]
MSFLLEATAIGLAWLALFALVDTIGDEMGAWPTLPLGALRDVELVAGFAAGLAVLAALLSRPRRSPGIG